jgi:hypothetical protein
MYGGRKLLQIQLKIYIKKIMIWSGELLTLGGSRTFLVQFPMIFSTWENHILGIMDGVSKEGKGSYV